MHLVKSAFFIRIRVVFSINATFPTLYIVYAIVFLLRKSIVLVENIFMSLKAYGCCHFISAISNTSLSLLYQLPSITTILHGSIYLGGWSNRIMKVNEGKDCKKYDI